MSQIKIIFNLFYKIIFLSKWVFTKPKNTQILVYDNESVKNFDSYLKNKKYEVFHVRFEQINIFVIFYTILSNGFRNLKQNYKINFFKFVSPKVVITLIDENPGFFKLKNIYKCAKYVSIQSCFKDNIFYDFIENYLKKQKNYKFGSDISFVLGENDKKKYKKYLDSKIVTLGSIRNNNYPIKKNYTSKIKEILFIGGKFASSRDYKIFKILKKYCKENKIKLNLLSKYPISYHKKILKFYGEGDWKYLPRENAKETYRIVNKAQFVVFDESTLGYEALSKNIKGVCFPEVFPYRFYSKNYKKKEGFFWSTKIDEKKFNHKINKVISLKQSEWKSVITKNVNKILFYNPNNKIFEKTLKKITSIKIISY